LGWTQPISLHLVLVRSLLDYHTFLRRAPPARCPSKLCRSIVDLCLSMNRQNQRIKADSYSYFVRYGVAPLWAKWESSPYVTHLRYLEKSQYRPLDEVRAEQWHRFKKLLVHAYLHTDYYARKMESSGLHPDVLHSWEDFVRLPILTKEDIRSHRDAMV